MFADLDESIRQLLIRHVPLDVAEVDVSFDAPDRDWSGRLSRPTVNCFLYDVRQNLERRDAEWQVTRDELTRTVTRKKGPLRIDSTYYVTVWARAPEDEHRLLWRVLTALARNPVLPSDVLAGGLVEQPYPLQAMVAQPDQNRTNSTDLWQALDNRVRPSLSYIVTLALDPSIEFTSPMVFTRVSRVGSTIDGMGGMDELVRIGGRVRSRGKGEEVVGARVRLRETGAEATTDSDGRFRFSGVPRGEVTLAVQVPGRKEVSRSTHVPSPTYDLEV